MSVRSVASVRKSSAMVALLGEDSRERGRIADVGVPVVPVTGNGFETAEPGKDGGGRFRSPAPQTRIAVGGVADERQIVGYRRRPHAELRDDSGLVAQLARAAIELDDARAPDALGEIFVGRADDHAVHTRVRIECRRGRRQRVVSLEFHHRPDGDAHHRERLLENRELRQQIRAARRPTSCSPARVRCGTIRSRDRSPQRCAWRHR